MSSDESIIVKAVFSDSSSSTASSSTESSSEETLIQRRKHHRSELFVETTIPKFDDRQFHEHFRVSWDVYHFLLEGVIKGGIASTSRKGREKVSAEKGLFLTLWYMANLETFRQIGDRFNVTRSTALIFVRRVVTHLTNSASQHIKWPNESASAIISERFRNKQGFPDVIGAIDGCHISIKKPTHHVTYCNRKGFTSIVLQSVCDDKKRFLDVFCGEPGSMHDARVLRRSSLYAKACIEGLTAGKYLLGDSAYPNLAWLVAPFRDAGHLTAQQRLFNYKHSSTRIVIENAFGMLKGRFRRLKCFDNTNIAFIVKAVVAACVSHNICINFNDTNVTEDTIDADVGHDLPQGENDVEEAGDIRQQNFDIIFNY